MLKNKNSRLASASLMTIAALACSQPALAEFIQDSEASLELRNIYLNRDFREGTGQSKRDEWAQGFLLKFQSGYTSGPIGFGVDALGMLGIKLDSSPDRVNTGLLPTHDDGRAADEFAHLGMTAKAKVSETVLSVGTHLQPLPVLKPNNGRIIPQTFDGVMLTSNDIGNLTFKLGRFDDVKQRNSSDFQGLQLNNKNSRFAGAVEADHFSFIGVDAPLGENLTATWYSAELDDVYRQHYLGAKYQHALPEGSLKLDTRLFTASDIGQSLGGDVDNRAISTMLSYSLPNHTFSLAWQKMMGNTGFAYVNGTDPFLVNFSQLNDFANPDEQSWQMRYDFNFAGVGIPGLTFMTRYVRGSGAEVIGSTQTGQEWERNSEMRYDFQSGPLKNLFVRYRNASFRSSFARDTDENRVILGYTIPLL